MYQFKDLMTPLCGFLTPQQIDTLPPLCGFLTPQQSSTLLEGLPNPIILRLKNQALK
jgi:hypothetical protein